jgi:hypothetical protein
VKLNKMNLKSDFPAWTKPADLEYWPTQVVKSATLRYALPLREGWDSTPQANVTSAEMEHIFRGMYASECLIVSFIDEADPAANLRNWVEVTVSITGFPILPMLQTDDVPKLLEWQYEGTCPPLTERLRVEETHLYQGMAKLPGRPPELARFYILLARRGTSAWKIILSFMSACPPDTPEEIIVSNDHVRAGATFGYLRVF